MRLHRKASIMNYNICHFIVNNTLIPKPLCIEVMLILYVFKDSRFFDEIKMELNEKGRINYILLNLRH